MPSRQHPGIELQLVVAASAIIERYGNVAAVMEEDGFPVTARVHSLLEGDTLIGAAKSTGIGMSELASVFEHLRPDLVVTVADRYETLATAAAAAYKQHPTRPHPGRRDHRLDRREGASCRHQARRSAFRRDRAGAAIM